jgi:putative intracellular protease/amidase
MAKPFRAALPGTPPSKEVPVLLRPDVVVRALDLQKRSYHLLRWVAERVDHGSLVFTIAHQYATLPSAAHGWLDAHYARLIVAPVPQHRCLCSYG